VRPPSQWFGGSALAPTVDSRIILAIARSTTPIPLGHVTYSHRWERPAVIAGPSWARVRNDISIALQLFQATSSNPTWREAGVEPVALRGPDGAGDPVVAPARVAFNGDGARNGAADPFILAQDARPEGDAATADGRVRASCDTALLPYDLAVCASLLIAKYHLGDAFLLESDGKVEELGWPLAREVAGTALGIRGLLREDRERGIEWTDVH